MKTCEERIDEKLQSRLDDIREICRKTREEDADLVKMIDEFGVYFDYVKGGTEGFFQWQLVVGGPIDLFRFFAIPSKYGWQPVSIEYWFLDETDKANRELKGADLQLLKWVFDFFAGRNE